MPELPEVETVVRTIKPAIVGRRILSVTTSGLPLRLGRALDRDLLDAVSRGARVADVRRRGKYILLDLRRGRAFTNHGVLVHLGMSGRLRVQAVGDARAPHTHVTWTLEGRRELRFVDPRRFGLVRASEAIDAVDELADLGPDPLSELTEADLARALAQTRAPLKSFLLDQKRIAGLGNIYVCEALFHARLHPRLPAKKARPRAAELLSAIRSVLNAAITNRGTTLRDYVDAFGGAGDNQNALTVYGRENQRCTRCSSIIRRRVDGGRSTFFCPTCQRR